MALVVVFVVQFVMGGWDFNLSLIGRVKLSKELQEERGEVGRLEERSRGRRWPWKKISSAGDKSTAENGGGDFMNLSGGCGRGWRSKDMVKENSWEGDEEGDCGFVCLDLG